MQKQTFSAVAATLLLGQTQAYKLKLSQTQASEVSDQGLDASEGDANVYAIDTAAIIPTVYVSTDDSGDATYFVDTAGNPKTEVQVLQDDAGEDVVVLNNVEVIPIDLGNLADDTKIVITQDPDTESSSTFVIQDASSEKPVVIEVTEEAPTLVIVDPTMPVYDLDLEGGEGSKWLDIEDEAYQIAMLEKRLEEERLDQEWLEQNMSGGEGSIWHGYGPTQRDDVILADGWRREYQEDGSISYCFDTYCLARYPAEAVVGYENDWTETEQIVTVDAPEISYLEPDIDEQQNWTGIDHNSLPPEKYEIETLGYDQEWYANEVVEIAPKKMILGGWWPVYDENGKYIQTCTSEGCTSPEEDLEVTTAPLQVVEITVPEDTLTVVQVVQSGDSTEPVVIYADQTDPELPALIIVDTGITDPSDVSIDVTQDDVEQPVALVNAEESPIDDQSGDTLGWFDENQKLLGYCDEDDNCKKAITIDLLSMEEEFDGDRPIINVGGYFKWDQYDDSGNFIGWCDQNRTCSIYQFDSDGNKIGSCTTDRNENKHCFDLEGNLLGSKQDKYSKYFEINEMPTIEVLVPEDVEVNVTFVDGEAQVPTVFEVTSDSQLDLNAPINLVIDTAGLKPEQVQINVVEQVEADSVTVTIDDVTSNIIPIEGDNIKVVTLNDQAVSQVYVVDQSDPENIIIQTVVPATPVYTELDAETFEETTADQVVVTKITPVFDDNGDITGFNDEDGEFEPLKPIVISGNPIYDYDHMDWKDNQDVSVIPVDVDEEALKLGGEQIPEPLDLPVISVIPVDIDWEDVRDGGIQIDPVELNYPNFKIPQTYSCDKKLSQVSAKIAEQDEEISFIQSEIDKLL